MGYAGWGLAPAWRERAAYEDPKVRFITHDGDAKAVIYDLDGDVAKRTVDRRTRIGTALSWRVSSRAERCTHRSPDRPSP